MGLTEIKEKNPPLCHLLVHVLARWLIACLGERPPLL